MRNTSAIELIMTRKPATVAPTDHLETVRRLFEKHGFHHIPVVDQGKLIGIVSYTDYLRIIREVFSGNSPNYAQPLGLEHMLVKEIMTEKVVCLHPNDTIEDALAVFRSHPFHAMPVIEGDRRLVGILSTYDLIKVLEKLLAPEIDYAS